MKGWAWIVVLSVLLMNAAICAGENTNQPIQGQLINGLKYSLESPDQYECSRFINPGNHETGLFYYDEDGLKIIADTRMVFIIYFNLQVENPTVAAIIETRLYNYHHRLIERLIRNNKNELKYLI